jgi:hypothetical protein
MKKKFQDGGSSDPLDSLNLEIPALPEAPGLFDSTEEEEIVGEAPLASQEESLGFIENIGTLSEGVAQTTGEADVDIISAPGEFGASEYDRFAGDQREMDDLEEIRGRSQTLFDITKNAAVNLAGGVALQVGGNIAGVANGLYEGVGEIFTPDEERKDPLTGLPISRGDAAIKAFINNDVFQFMDEQQEALRENFPIYYTRAEREKDLMSQAFTTKFWADTMVNGAVFLVGAALTEFLYTGAGTLVGNVAGGSAAFIAGMARVSQLQKMLGTSAVMNRAVRGGKYLKDASKGYDIIGKTKAGATLTRQLITGSGYESALEARMTYDEMLDSMLDDHYGDRISAAEKTEKRELTREEKIKLLTPEEASSIDKIATNFTNGVFAGNMVLVGTSNIIMLGNLYRPKFSMRIKNPKYNPLDNLVQKIGGGETAMKYSNAALRWAGKNFYEGVIEEGGQGFLNRTALNYAALTQIGNTGMVESVASLSEAMARAKKDVLYTKEGNTEILAGALLAALGLPGAKFGGGMLMTPHLRQQEQRLQGISNFQKYQNEVMDIVQKARERNPLVMNSTISMLVATTLVQARAEAYQKAVDAGNIKLAKDIENQNIVDMVLHYHDTQQMSQIKNYEDQINEMGITEFKEMFDYDPDMSEEDVLERKSEVITRTREAIKRVVKAANAVDKAVGFRPEEKTNYTTKDKSIGYLRRNLIMNAASIDFADAREEELVREIAEMTNGTVTEVPNNIPSITFEDAEGNFKTVRLGAANVGTTVEAQKLETIARIMQLTKERVKGMTIAEQNEEIEELQSYLDYLGSIPNDELLGRVVFEDLGTEFVEEVNKFISESPDAALKTKELLEKMTDVRELRADRLKFIANLNTLMDPKKRDGFFEDAKKVATEAKKAKSKKTKEEAAESAQKKSPEEKEKEKKDKQQVVNDFKKKLRGLKSDLTEKLKNFDRQITEKTKEVEDIAEQVSALAKMQNRAKKNKSKTASSSVVEDGKKLNIEEISERLEKAKEFLAEARKEEERFQSEVPERKRELQLMLDGIKELEDKKFDPSSYDPKLQDIHNAIIEFSKMKGVSLLEGATIAKEEQIAEAAILDESISTVSKKLDDLKGLLQALENFLDKAGNLPENILDLIKEDNYIQAILDRYPDIEVSITELQKAIEETAKELENLNAAKQATEQLTQQAKDVVRSEMFKLVLAHEVQKAAEDQPEYDHVLSDDSGKPKMYKEEKPKAEDLFKTDISDGIGRTVGLQGSYMIGKSEITGSVKKFISLTQKKMSGEKLSPKEKKDLKNAESELVFFDALNNNSSVNYGKGGLLNSWLNPKSKKPQGTVTVFVHSGMFTEDRIGDLPPQLRDLKDQFYDNDDLGNDGKDIKAVIGVVDKYGKLNFLRYQGRLIYQSIANPLLKNEKGEDRYVNTKKNYSEADIRSEQASYREFREAILKTGSLQMSGIAGKSQGSILKMSSKEKLENGGRRNFASEAVSGAGSQANTLLLLSSVVKNDKDEYQLTTVSPKDHLKGSVGLNLPSITLRSGRVAAYDQVRHALIPMIPSLLSKAHVDNLVNIVKFALQKHDMIMQGDENDPAKASSAVLSTELELKGVKSTLATFLFDQIHITDNSEHGYNFKLKLIDGRYGLYYGNGDVFYLEDFESESKVNELKGFLAEKHHNINKRSINKIEQEKTDAGYGTRNFIAKDGNEWTYFVFSEDPLGKDGKPVLAKGKGGKEYSTTYKNYNEYLLKKRSEAGTDYAPLMTEMRGFSGSKLILNKGAEVAINTAMNMRSEGGNLRFFTNTKNLALAPTSITGTVSKKTSSDDSVAEEEEEEDEFVDEEVVSSEDEPDLPDLKDLEAEIEEKNQADKNTDEFENDAVDADDYEDDARISKKLAEESGVPMDERAKRFSAALKSEPKSKDSIDDYELNRLTEGVSFEKERLLDPIKAGSSDRVVQFDKDGNVLSVGYFDENGNIVDERGDDRIPKSNIDRRIRDARKGRDEILSKIESLEESIDRRRSELEVKKEDDITEDDEDVFMSLQVAAASKYSEQLSDKALAGQIERALKMRPLDITMAEGLLRGLDGPAVAQLTGYSKVLLSSLAASGAIFHETFHDVSLYVLSPKDASILYNKVRQIPGETITYKGEAKKMSELTDKEADEWLAEEFRMYVITGGEHVIGKGSTKDTRSILKKFFDAISALVRRVLRLNEKFEYDPNISSIEGLFKDIEGGKFFSAKRNMERGKPGTVDMIAKLPGFSQKVTNDMIYSLSAHLGDLFGEYFNYGKDENGNDRVFGPVNYYDLYSPKSRELNKENFNAMYLKATANLRREVRNALNEKNISPEKKEALQDVDDFLSASENRRILRILHLQSMNDLGFAMAEDQEQDEADVVSRNWVDEMDALKVSASKSAPGVLKLMLSTIRDDSTENSFGIKGSYKVGKLLKQIQRVMANTTTYREQMTKLQELSGVFDVEEEAQMYGAKPVPKKGFEWAPKVFDMFQMGSLEGKRYEEVKPIIAFTTHMAQAQLDVEYTKVSPTGEIFVIDPAKESVYSGIRRNWTANLKSLASNFQVTGKMRASGLQAKMTKLIEKYINPTAKKYLPKEQVKTRIATQYIGDGSSGSSTDQYRQMYETENLANTGTYSNNDIIYVSSNGKRKGRINPVKNGTLQGVYRNIDAAIVARAAFVMDTQDHLERTGGYNIGEAALAEYLESKGYKRVGRSGVWKPAASITAGMRVSGAHIKIEDNKIVVDLDEPFTHKFAGKGSKTTTIRELPTIIRKLRNDAELTSEMFAIMENLGVVMSDKDAAVKLIESEEMLVQRKDGQVSYGPTELYRDVEAIIQDLIARGSGSYANLFDREYATAVSRMNNLVKIEEKTGEKDVELMFLNSENNMESSVIRYHHLSYLIAKKYHEVAEYFDVERYPFGTNSKAVQAFREGKEFKIVNLSGLQADMPGQVGNKVTGLGKKDIAVVYINSTLKDTFINLRAADQSTEFGIKFPFRVEDTFEKAAEVALGYIYDEMASSAKNIDALKFVKKLNREISPDGEIKEGKLSSLRMMKAFLTAEQNKEIEMKLADPAFRNSVQDEMKRPENSGVSPLIKDYIEENREEFKKSILSRFERDRELTKNYFEEKGLLSKDSGIGMRTFYGVDAEFLKEEGKEASQFVSNEKVDEVIEKFLAKHFVAKTEMFKLFYNDPAFYSDMFKRLKGTVGTKIMSTLDPEILEWLNTDRLLYRTDGKIDALHLREPMYRLKSELLDFYKEKFGEESDVYKAFAKEIEYSDGMMIIDLPTTRLIGSTTDQWSPPQENTYQMLTRSEDKSVEYYTEDGGAITQLKTQYNGPVNVYRSSVEKVPGQAFLKMSMLPLYDQMAYIGGKKYPNILKMLEFMRNERVGALILPSAIKVGGPNDLAQVDFQDPVVKVNPNTGQEELVYDMDFTDKVKESASKMELDMRFLGVQLEISPFFKGKTTSTVQIQAQALSDIYEDGVIAISDPEEDVEDIVKKFNGALNGLTRKAFSEMLTEFQIERTDRDGIQGYTMSSESYRKVLETLAKEGTSVQAGSGLLGGIQYLSDRDEEFKMEYFVDRYRMETMLMSAIGKKVVRKKILGDQAVQMPILGYEVVEDANGITYDSSLTFYERDDKWVAQVMLPHWFKEIYDARSTAVLNQDGTMSIDGVDVEIDPEVLEIIGIRIPTDGIHSAEIFEVVGFFPKHMGSKIAVPPGILTKAGSDFDIDKLTLYFMAYKLQEGKVSTVKFYYDLENWFNAERSSMQGAMDFLNELKEILPNITESADKVRAFDDMVARIATLAEGMYFSKAMTPEKELQLFTDMFVPEHMPYEDKIEELKKYYEQKFGLLVETNDALRREILQDRNSQIFRNVTLPRDLRSILDNKGFDALLKEITRKIAILEEVYESRRIEEESFEDWQLANPNETIYTVQSSKAMNNEYIRLMKKLLALKERQETFLKPVGTPLIDRLSKELEDIFNDENNLQDAPVNLKEVTDYHAATMPHNLIDVTYSYLQGKKDVGIWALASTHTVKAQIVGMKFNMNTKYRIPKKKGNAELVNAAINFDYKPFRLKRTDENLDFEAGGIISMSNIFGEDGFRISEAMSEGVNASVDTVNNPVLHWINLNPDLAPAGIALLRVGVPFPAVVAFTNQPIVREYMEELSANSGHLSTALNELYPNYKEYEADIIEKLLLKYSERLREDENYSSTKEEPFMFTAETLKPMIAKTPEQLTPEQQEMQLQILKDLIVYLQIGDDQTSLINAQSFDTRVPKSRAHMRLIMAQYQEVLSRNVFPNAENITESDELYLSALREYNELGDSLFEDLFIAEDGTLPFKAVFEKVLNKQTKEVENGFKSAYSKLLISLAHPSNRKSLDKKLRVLERFEQFYITTIVQSVTGPLGVISQHAGRLLYGKNGASMAETLLEIQTTDHPLKDNPFMQSFIPVVQEERDTRTKNDYIEPRFKTLNMYDDAEIVDAYEQIVAYDARNNTDYASDLWRTAVLQAGMMSTPFSFLDRMPGEMTAKTMEEVYARYSSNTIRLNDPNDASIGTGDLMLKLFAQNMIYDNDIVPFVKNPKYIPQSIQDYALFFKSYTYVPGLKAGEKTEGKAKVKRDFDLYIVARPKEARSYESGVTVSYDKVDGVSLSSRNFIQAYVLPENEDFSEEQEKPKDHCK